MLRNLAGPKRDQAGWLRNRLRETEEHTQDNPLTKMQRTSRVLGTHGPERLRNPVITFDEEAMALFRWIDSACQTVACFYQYMDPEVAAELRNLNRMLGKLCGLFALFICILACVSDPELLAPRPHGDAAVKVSGPNHALPRDAGAHKRPGVPARWSEYRTGGSQDPAGRRHRPHAPRESRRPPGSESVPRPLRVR